MTLVDGAVPQIQVDQRLIGDTRRLGLCLEIVDGAAVNVDGDLPLSPCGAWISPWIQAFDVVFVSHIVASQSLNIASFLSSGHFSC